MTVPLNVGTVRRTVASHVLLCRISRHDCRMYGLIFFPLSHSVLCPCFPFSWHIYDWFGSCRVLKKLRHSFAVVPPFSYICCNQVGFIWLSTDWIKLARERAMDKKKPDCSEPPYFSCFQITLYLTCKDNISFWKGHINGCNLTE